LWWINLICVCLIHPTTIWLLFLASVLLDLYLSTLTVWNWCNISLDLLLISLHHVSVRLFNICLLTLSPVQNIRWRNLLILIGSLYLRLFRCCHSRSYVMRIDQRFHLFFLLWHLYLFWITCLISLLSIVLSPPVLRIRILNGLMTVDIQ